MHLCIYGTCIDAYMHTYNVCPFPFFFSSSLYLVLLLSSFPPFPLLSSRIYLYIYIYIYPHSRHFRCREYDKPRCVSPRPSFLFFFLLPSFTPSFVPPLLRYFLPSLLHSFLHSFPSLLPYTLPTSKGT